MRFPIVTIASCLLKSICMSYIWLAADAIITLLRCCTAFGLRSALFFALQPAAYGTQLCLSSAIDAACYPAAIKHSSAPVP